MASFLKTIEADLLANKVIASTANRSAIMLFKHIWFGLVFKPNFACVFWYRINRILYSKKIPGKNLLSAWRFYRFANDISFLADIGPGLRLGHVIDIVIGGGARIGARATIYNGVTIGAKGFGDKLMPSVGDDVFIGTGAKVLGDIKIGNNVTIGALAFCNKNIPDNMVAYGIPPNFTVRSK